MRSLENIELSSIVYLLLGIHCIIGIVAANIAIQKGYNLTKWIIWGLVGGTPALMAAMWLKPKN